MTTVDTSKAADWLAQAEAAYAAEETETEAEAACVRAAKSMADELNERLTQLGITPLTRAVADGDSIAPALLAPEDPARQFYGVYATFDEEDGPVLLVSDYHGKNGFQLRPASIKLDGPRSVVVARRYGPAPTPQPKPKPQLSADAQAIVEVLGDLANAVENAALSVARAVGRP
ncbi:hypothetical protein [Streptomyces sp. NPDC093223]|uniref:hypothetical protein n=1 Tax=Streptomyces sp. NPDC093223 TaxID=3366033 RepID=UPI003815E929